jgi:hypothetical protein
MIDNIFMTRNQNYPRGSEWHGLTGHIIPKKRTMTYNVVAALWSRRNHLMGTRFLSSSDGRDNNLSVIPCRARTKILINLATLFLGLFNNYTYCSYLPQFFPYLKLKLMSVPQRWVEMLTLPLAEECPWP